MRLDPKTSDHLWYEFIMHYAICVLCLTSIPSGYKSLFVGKPTSLIYVAVVPVIEGIAQKAAVEFVLASTSIGFLGVRKHGVVMVPMHFI